MRPRFSIHLDVDPQELNYLFQVGFFDWVSNGIMHPQPERTPFKPPRNIHGILIPTHVSLQPEVPTNDSWKEIVNHLVSQHHGWPTMSFPLPPPINPNVQIACVVSPIQCSHASKRLKLMFPNLCKTREKQFPPLLPPPLIPRNLCLLAFI
jgi:hypothetical protein